MSLLKEEVNKDRYYTQIGDVSVILESDLIDNKPYDTKVMLEDGSVLCNVSGEDRERFIQELDEIISRYRI
jgi:hypothetical protein